MDANAVISAALQIGAAAVPLVPEMQALFGLATTLVNEGRQPTAEESAGLQAAIDTAHQQAQVELAAATQAQTAAAAAASAAQAKVAVLAPLATGSQPSG